MYTKEIKQLKSDILKGAVDTVTIKESLLSKGNIDSNSMQVGLFYEAIKECFLDEFQLNVEFSKVPSEIITKEMLDVIGINHLKFIFKKLDINTIYIADINTIDINEKVNSVTLRFEETDDGVEMYPIASDFDDMNDWIENRANDKAKDILSQGRLSDIEEKGIQLSDYTMFMLVMYILEALVLINSLSNTREIKTSNRKYVYSTSSKKGKRKKKGPRKVKIVSSFYISESDIDKDSVKREYNRTVESWKVKGHSRRYKSGKVVWIQPYTKGKGNKAPKNYEV